MMFHIYKLLQVYFGICIGIIVSAVHTTPSKFQDFPGPST